MNTAPHLLPEDRPEFERALKEALRTAPQRPALAGLGEGLGAEQLRIMALSAATAIAACAAPEYDHFVRLRNEWRDPANAPSPSGARGRGTTGARTAAGTRDAERSDVPDPGAEDATDAGGSRGGTAAEGGLSLAGAIGEGVGEPAGVGLIAMASVLVPVLAGTAAVIFLLLGYVLHAMTPEPAIAASMRGAGWVFAVLAAVGAVIGMAELWLTAVRNGTGARGAGDGTSADEASGLADEVAAARAAWRQALLERGIVPFLSKALADFSAADGDGHDAGEESGAPGARVRGTHAPASYAPAPDGSSGGSRTPRLGYSGPDFSSRSPSDGTDEKDGSGARRPRYSSPDFSSPDYGGPEHPPE